MEKKKCSKCGVEKDIDEFSLRSDTGKIRRDCKECIKKRHKEYHKKWYIKNKEKKDKQNKEWYEKHPDKVIEYNKKWYDNNIDKVLAKNKRIAERDPEKQKEYRRRTYQNSKKYPQKRLKRIIGSKISTKLSERGGSKEGKSSFKDILPYTVIELIEHLESLFEENMSWDNYGQGDGKWHIDHDVPDSWFKYKSPDDEEFQKSWALNNLQPMWGSDNCRKRNKFSGKKGEI